jgi:predicted nucleotidyltransferase
MIANEIRSSLQKICYALNKHSVEYMLVGGVAVGFYGYQRISGASFPGRPEIVHDIDFWYKPVVENFVLLVKALDELGIETQSLKDIIFDSKKTFLRIPFNTFKAEFLPIISGLDSFSECKRNANRVKLDENEIAIISYNDLLVNKEAMAREIDKRDIAELKKRNSSFESNG